MPLWTTRSSIWRAISASYAFCGGSRPTPRRAAVWVMAPAPRQPILTLTNRRLPEPRRVGALIDQPLPPELEARIAARVEREATSRTQRRVTLARPAAVKANGGLRGSTATRWSR